jgi:hypothetical protein
VRRNTRGRPLKFGRPAQLIALTLPEDVVEWLRRIHPDPAWAIVSLFESGKRGSDHSRSYRATSPELAPLPGRRALIVVRPDVCQNLPGVSVIPMGLDRAFLALEGERGIADLELAILDRLDDPRVAASERRRLQHLRPRIREWRRSSRLRFSRRSIILVQDRASAAGRMKRAGRPA